MDWFVSQVMKSILFIGIYRLLMYAKVQINHRPSKVFFYSDTILINTFSKMFKIHKLFLIFIQLKLTIGYCQ